VSILARSRVRMDPLRSGSFMIWCIHRLAGAAQTLRPPVVCLLLLTACAPAMRSTAGKPVASTELAQLWVEPDDIASRDLFYGPGGRESLPPEKFKFKVIRFDPTGNSPGYDVLDDKEREWKVKVGEEVQPEIVASRLLWAIGFHQPSMHMVGNLQLDGGRTEDAGQPARLRAEFGYKTEAEWSWHENPFVGTRYFKGLLVANLILNNWDLKDSQNRIYVDDDSSDRPRRRYVVQDLGAALGKTAWPVGTRSRIEDFERQNLIQRVENGRVTFDYHARHKELFEDITPEDVVWTARLFARLSDTHWSDAFRAARYPDNVSTRFIAKLKSKVQEGLALEKRAAVTP
jgi:hypothetical protein